MADDDKRALANFRKRRGVVKASITRIETRLSALESTPDEDTVENARQLLSKLKTCDTDFKDLHMSVVDLVDEEEPEQATLDHHDDLVASMTLRIQKLIAKLKPPPDRRVESHKLLTRKLKRVQDCLSAVNDAVGALTGDAKDIHRLRLREEQLGDSKKDLSAIKTELMSLDLTETDELVTKQTELEQLLFDCSLRIRELLARTSTPTTFSTHTESPGLKLPKLDVPTFSGNILQWRNFWEQFVISVHNRTTLSNSEKLVYLQQALKGGSARNAVEGLSRSGENYEEAIKCLTDRYDRPRLIHQAHVKAILEAAPLKEGTGKEVRRLHDSLQQHLRALKAMGYDPPGPFVTSTIELKLDTNTMFEWQKHSQKSSGVPDYKDLLEFLNLRAQASESSVPDANLRKSKLEIGSSKKVSFKNGAIASFATSADDQPSSPKPVCVLCGPERHPLYACPKFRGMQHDTKVSTLKTHGMCMNCLGHNHFAKNCKSIHRCKTCQKPHHSLLHIDRPHNVTSTPIVTPTSTEAVNSTPAAVAPQSEIISSHTSTPLKSNSLLMTCRVLVKAPDGTYVEARALLDNASSASFISERLSQSLQLPRSNQSLRISGIAGLSCKAPLQSVASFTIAPIYPSDKRFDVTAIVVPQVTCDLPLHPIPLKTEWNHLTDLQLADPGFGCPGKIDVLLGVDVFVDVLCHGRRSGPPGSPIAFETHLGWVLAGSILSCLPNEHVTTHHTLCISGDELLRKFWEVEENPRSGSNLTPEEQKAIQYFRVNHSRQPNGRFVVPLPKKENAKQLGESRSHALRRFLSLERSLRYKGQFEKFGEVIQEYFDLGHAEIVPADDLNKPPTEVFYLPMHAVHKESSTTTKIRAVFDASMKTTSGISLNDTLIVGPTVHPPLIDVLLRFRMHRIAIVADISKMYRAVELPPADRDLHRFLWRSGPKDPLKDCRMTRVTFGVASSAFTANMSVKQNAIEFAHKYPLASKVVEESFYVDDCLSGADSEEEGIQLQTQLQNLFAEADFLLRKWNSSNPAVLQAISPELRDTQTSLTISESDEIYSKTLGIAWHSVLDHFKLSVTDQPPPENLTKRQLVSDIAKIYDVLGWFSPSTIKSKILLQRLWESKVEWDDPVPPPIKEEWMLWRSQLKYLQQVHIPRCYFPKQTQIVSFQIHGFSDASESAYAGVVYFRMTDRDGAVSTALIASKTKVAPIKRLTIPRLELCGAYLLTKLLEHVRTTLKIPIEQIYAWTDSTIVINWLDGSPRRFKTYVGNRVSFIIDRIPPNRWNHVSGEQNPADCASRGLFPLELIEHKLWWNGPDWLKLHPSNWPKSPILPPDHPSAEEREICLLTNVVPRNPVIALDRFSSFARLVRVTAWIMRFVAVCRSKKENRHSSSATTLTVAELSNAENYWILHSQRGCFNTEIESLKLERVIPSSSKLLSLRPFIDSNGIMRVGGRQQNANLTYSAMHPVILQGTHLLTRLIVRSEHERLLHAGPTLLTSVLNRRFHIVGCRKVVRDTTRSCSVCRRHAEKPRPQMMGQLPIERVTPDIVFENVGIDYAGPLYIKHGYVRKPTVVKAYVCVFVSMSVKAIHLELVSDLTSDAFIAALRRFIARRGKPSLIQSDHGSNFVGAKKELKEIAAFLQEQKNQILISQFCTSQRIQWKFIPERSPHFGGIWEAAVKSFKFHLKRVTANTKFTFEECYTILTQIEACLNSRPLMATPCDEDGIEMLTPGHFLIGRPIEALPDSSYSFRSISLLRRWHMCQNIVRHFWRRWSQEYLSTLRKFVKWQKPNRNISVGDVVVLHEDNMIPTQWPLGRVIETFKGNDDLVRVVNVKTQKGIFKRPIHKLALLMESEN